MWHKTFLPWTSQQNLEKKEEENRSDEEEEEEDAGKKKKKSGEEEEEPDDVEEYDEEEIEEVRCVLVISSVDVFRLGSRLCLSLIKTNQWK